VAELEVGESSAEAAINRADARLYEAKAGGRNQVR
jgi:PleD family two-component response regulator